MTLQPQVLACMDQDEIPGDCQRVMPSGNVIDEILQRFDTCKNDTEFLIMGAGGLVAGVCAEHVEEWRRDAPADWYTSIERLAVIV